MNPAEQTVAALVIIAFTAAITRQILSVIRARRAGARGEAAHYASLRHAESGPQTHVVALGPQRTSPAEFAAHLGRIERARAAAGLPTTLGTVTQGPAPERQAAAERQRYVTDHLEPTERAVAARILADLDSAEPERPAQPDPTFYDQDAVEQAEREAAEAAAQSEADAAWAAEVAAHTARVAAWRASSDRYRDYIAGGRSEQKRANRERRRRADLTVVDGD